MTRSSSRKRSIEDIEDIETKRADDEPSSDNEINDTGLSEYEKTRIENIRRNQQYLSSLGLDEVRTTIHESAAARKPATKKGVTKRVKVPLEALPARRSGRVTTERLRVELEELKKADGSSDAIQSKTKELNELREKKHEGSYEQVIDAQASSWQRKRLDSGPIKLLERDDKETVEDGEDAAEGNSIVENKKMLSLMSSLSLDKTSPIKAGKGKAKVKVENTISKTTIGPIKSSDYTKRIQKMKVAEADVAKLTQDRIVSVMVHPSPHKVVVFAGDKSGHLGIWDVDSTDEKSGGVYKYQPHATNISKIHTYAEEPTKVYSVSYDGTVRCLDTSSHAFVESFQIPESLDDIFLTDASFLTSNNSSVLVSKNDGCISFIDFRASNKSYQWSCEVQNAKVNSVQQHPSQEHYVITGGMGASGCINIHDMRKLKAGSKQSPVASMNPHTKSINAAYVSPDGESLVSVSQDNTIRTSRNFMANKGITSLVTRHDNHTGRWLSTFKPTFDPKQPQAFVMGSMLQPRGVEIFHIGNSSDGAGAFPVDLIHTFRSPYLASVCSRNDFHPTLDIVACGNSSGRIHVAR